MKDYCTKNIRNIAVVGHGGEGKTTLGRGAAVRHRDDRPPGPRGGWNHHHGL